MSAMLPPKGDGALRPHCGQMRPIRRTALVAGITGTTRASVRGALETAGFDSATTVRSATAAVAAMRDQSFDAVIVGEGIGTAALVDGIAELRTVDRTPVLVVIGVDSGIADELLDAGADIYVTRRATADDLSAALQQALHRTVFLAHHRREERARREGRRGTAA